jgi:hypothetical protein
MRKDRPNGRSFLFGGARENCRTDSRFYASTAATIQRINTRTHNPLNNQTGDPRKPEKPTTMARMATMRIEIAHDSILEGSVA